MKHLHKHEKGSAIIYILIAIALLGALTASLMGAPSQQTQSQNRMKTMSEIESQVNLIRSAIEECVLLYPKGDNTIDISASGTDEGAIIRYPLNPNSQHFSGATEGPSGDRLVRDIRCPGNPGDDQNHAMIFGGASGKFLPPPPDLFEPWQWYNGKDGVFFWTETSRSDAYLASALQKLDEEYGEDEADVIDASTGPVNLDAEGDTQCSNGALCFRVWIIDKT